MRATYRSIGLALALGCAVSPSLGDDDLHDLFFGEALFHAYQGRYFEALARLDTELSQYHELDEPRLDTLHVHVDDAEFSVGDFELHYRMHHRAGRAIKAVLEGAVDEVVRNEAAYRLARIHFQKGQHEDALHALSRIEGALPPALHDDVEFLRANVYLATGRAGDAAAVLEAVESDADLAGFVDYNLGIALLREGRTAEAIERLDAAGRRPAGDAGGLAIRDKSNLVLGSVLFEAGDYGRARQSLDRVRLEGPLSNRALLRAGWAETEAERHERALVPWKLLLEREPTDVAVQEAMLAAPHAYAELDLHGRAAILYGRALRTYVDQIERIDASLASIREGRFLEALVRGETRHDKEWVIRLRSLPDAPETYYLMELMASHDFQTALQNYLDLEDLQSKLRDWKTGLDAFEDLIRYRHDHYEPLLPGIDARFRELDARMRLRLEQRELMSDRLRSMLTMPRPDQLATAEEQRLVARLARVDARLGDAEDPLTENTRARVERARGVLTWRLETEYHDRLTTAYANLEDLETHIEEMTARYDAFVRTRQAATHSYVGYDVQIERLRARVVDALERIERLMTRQGHLIETVAMRRLDARRERLVAQKNQAHYAVADSYDRAARANDPIEPAASTEGPEPETPSAPTATDVVEGAAGSAGPAAGAEAP